MDEQSDNEQLTFSELVSLAYKNDEEIKQALDNMKEKLQVAHDEKDIGKVHRIKDHVENLEKNYKVLRKTIRSLELLISSTDSEVRDHFQQFSLKLFEIIKSNML